MDNYVTLTLDKYNELYDKANNYDKYIAKLSKEIGDNISNIIDKYENEKKEQKYEFKVGDKVQVQDLLDGYAIINQIYSDKTAHVNFINNNYIDCCYPLSELKKIEESEDK